MPDLTLKKVKRNISIIFERLKNVSTRHAKRVGKRGGVEGSLDPVFM